MSAANGTLGYVRPKHKRAESATKQVWGYELPLQGAQIGAAVTQGAATLALGYNVLRLQRVLEMGL